MPSTIRVDFDDPNLVANAGGLRLTPNDRTDVVNATKLALRSLARRVRSID